MSKKNLIGSDMHMAGSLWSFLQARAGQASETVLVLNSDKATTRTIINYVNNKSNEMEFTPYEPQEKREEDVFFATVYLIVKTTMCQTVISVGKR